NAALGMPPSQQGFCAYDCPIAEAQLRLKIKLELVIRKRTPQFYVELSARHSLGAKHREEHPIRAASRSLRLIEREVGIGDELLAIRSIVRRHRDPRARPDIQEMIACFDALGQAV